MNSLPVRRSAAATALLALLMLLSLAASAFAQAQSVRVHFEARLTEDGEAVNDGIEWRIFSDRVDESGKLKLLSQSTGGKRTFEMRPGEYLVHAAYGHAAAVRKVKIEEGQGETTEVFDLNAGGLALSAVAGDDTPIPNNLLRFDVYEDKQDERGVRKLIARKVLPGQVIPFQAGIYHVVSQYGNYNAEIRADLKVESGKLTRAELTHLAAQVTLRLVRNKGGDALADTKWSVITESGELISESTSAFPRFVLLEGTYTAIARNNDKIYSQDFTVQAGVNRDVEVLVEG